MIISKAGRIRASPGVSVCALDRVIGATSEPAAGLGEEFRAAQNQGGPFGILPVAMQRAKLQSSVQPKQTGGGMQPLG